jgi:monofunctional biosynthetic peptidoglycan transglycosylase
MIKFLISIVIAVACLVGLVGAGVGAFLLTTPQPKDIKGCITAKMFEVKLCPGQNGYTKLKDISVNLRNAVIVSEDGAFYTHQGLDLFELQESLNKNLEKGEFARGGSTITQQLAKNVYLTQEKSLVRKAREALIAIQLEKILTKDEILEKYLNVVEFGPNLYGAHAASKHYFGKSPSQLTPAEGAFLAFLLPSPKKHAVSFQKKKLTPFARNQLKIIVGRMQKYKKITDYEHEEALAQIDHFFGAPPEIIPADQLENPPLEESYEESESEDSESYDEAI